MKLTIKNQGPLILSSNYWGSAVDRAATLYLSCNSGAFRLLLPSGWEQEVDGMRSGKTAIISRGAWQGTSKEAIEILLDNGSDEPYSIHLGLEQVDRPPTPENVEQDWLFAVWTGLRGKPRKALERPARYRIVETIPWLKPLEDNG